MLISYVLYMKRVNIGRKTKCGVDSLFSYENKACICSGHSSFSTMKDLKVFFCAYFPVSSVRHYKEHEN